MALAWINPKEYNEETGVVMVISTWRKRKPTGDSCVSSLRTNSSTTAHSISFRSPVLTKSRAAVMTDETLDINGKHKLWLNIALDHLPNEPTISSNPRCALHQWVGKEKKAQIIKCTTCNVNLCLTSYKLSCNVADLVSIKKH